LLPAGRPVRVRGLEVHDQALAGAPAGQRVAVNLSGVAVLEVARGDVLTAGAELQATYLIDAALSFGDREPQPGDRVHVHHGTRETPARLAWLGGRFWQLRLARPLVAARDDRLVIRQIAPPDTLGGGVVLDPHPRKHGPGRELLAHLERLSRGEQVELASPDRRPTAQAAKPEALAGRQRPPAPLSGAALAVEARLRETGLQPPLDAELDADALAALRQAGRAIRVSKTMHYHADVLDEARGRLVALAQRHGGAVTLAQLRDELATSRKFAQALLEHFDAERVTIRRGDAHHLRRQAQVIA
jgi:selenocysteine-specific elongation factor